MGTKTTRLDLTKPGENDYYNQQTEQADNWQKVDDYAVYTDRDKNAIWGGLDGGGLIEDPSVTKVAGKRYIGADGKAYICLVPSNINNSTNYAPCNVVDNLGKINNLGKVENFVGGNKIRRFEDGKTVEISNFASAPSEFINVDFGVTLKTVHRVNITPVTNSINAVYPTTMFELASNSGMRIQCPFIIANGTIIKPTSIAFYWSVLGEL